MFEIYKGKHILVTGHTGFKGSWLTSWLTHLGAAVYGYSLEPNTQPSHYDLITAHPTTQVGEVYFDIRNRNQIENFISKMTIKPDLIFHMAAQPIVSESFKNPTDTFYTNILGTINVIEACRDVESVLGIVNITTDKVYNNKYSYWGYRECDPLGTDEQDPYSASKVCAEIVSKSYRQLVRFPVINVRAGNVIGGGDWGKDRLVPDIVRSIVSGKKLQIRTATSVRPWNFILDCLQGYLLVGEKILKGWNLKEQEFNFAPGIQNCVSVYNLISLVEKEWRTVDINFIDTFANETDKKPLKLDSTLAEDILKWKPLYSISSTIKDTIHWYKEYYTTGKILTIEQIKDYMKLLEEVSK